MDHPFPSVIRRIWHKRLLRIALVCLALAFLPAIPPVARTLDNLWRRVTEPRFALPQGARLWKFRAMDRTDRSPGWTCAEDDLHYFFRADTGVRTLRKRDLSSLADPCALPEDPDTLLPDDALLPLEADTNEDSAESRPDSVRP